MSLGCRLLKLIKIFEIFSENSFDKGPFDIILQCFYRVEQSHLQLQHFYLALLFAVAVSQRVARPGHERDQKFDASVLIDVRLLSYF